MSTEINDKENVNKLNQSYKLQYRHIYIYNEIEWKFNQSANMKIRFNLVSMSRMKN